MSPFKRICRAALLSLCVLTASASSTSAQTADVQAWTVYTTTVTAAAAAWTDFTITSTACVSERCITSGEPSWITVYSSGAACYLLLKANSGEAATAGIFIPSGGSITLQVYGSMTADLSVHGNGNTPDVSFVVGWK